MELLRLADVPASEGELEFRHSPARALLALSAGLGGGAALLWAGWRTRSWLPAAAGGVVLLTLLVLRRLALARLRPSNWLLRVTDGGLFIQFRSHLNWHLPGEDLTVVFVPGREIRAVRLVRQRRLLPAAERGGRITQQRRRLVEFELAGDCAALARALAEERARRAPRERRWYGSTSTLYRHHPLRLSSPTTLQLEWCVVPSHRVLFERLGRHASVAPETRVEVDFRHLRQLPRREQDERLLELVETGEVVAAIQAAREIHSLGLTEARALVEGLRRRGQ